jgi:hypothetical protein
MFPAELFPEPLFTAELFGGQGGSSGTSVFLDIFARRGLVEPGWNPHGFIELYGATLVEVTAFEPDPVTYRKPYYYNAVLNRLYRKVTTVHRPEIGVIRAHWVAVSN